MDQLNLTTSSASFSAKSVARVKKKKNNFDVSARAETLRVRRMNPIFLFLIFFASREALRRKGGTASSLQLT